MKNIFLISVIGYLSILAATQTVYGGQLMSLRWVMLIVLLATSSLYWLMIRLKKGTELSLDKSASVLLLYLSATFLTVVFAENPLFSGFRWASHVMMLIIFIIFFRQNIAFTQIQELFLIIK